MAAVELSDTYRILSSVGRSVGRLLRDRERERARAAKEAEAMQLVTPARSGFKANVARSVSFSDAPFSLNFLLFSD